MSNGTEAQNLEAPVFVGQSSLDTFLQFIINKVMLELVICQERIIVSLVLSHHILTIVGVSDMPRYRLTGRTTSGKAGEFLVQHLLELVSGQPRHAPVGLELLQLLQTPVQTLQGLSTAGVKTIVY